MFEKGKTLPIPEIVPFRLTREIKAGLGPLEFEGPFRMNCEATLEVRKVLVIMNKGSAFIFERVVADLAEDEHQRICDH